MVSADRPQPSRREAFPVFRTLTTRWSDNDVYGHLNNVVHYSLFDSAINGFLIEEGVLDPRGGDTIGLVVETGCRYHAELAYPQPVEAGLKVAHTGTSSVRYEIGLFAPGGEIAAADGHFVHVYVDAASRRPRPLNDNLRAALRRLAA